MEVDSKIMSYCDIVVDACPKKDVQLPLEFARKLALETGARLSVVSYAWPRYSGMRPLVGNALSAQLQEREMIDALDTARSAFGTVFDDNAVEAEWCSGVAEPNVVLRDHLWTADLLITSASESKTCAPLNAADLALRSGAPILRLGTKMPEASFANVLVAWKDCSQARRAVHDALPILQRTGKVTVVGVGDEVAIERLEMVADHLRRHGVTAEHLHIPRTHGKIGEDLLAEAQRVDASLIVAGVFSRGSLRERVLGGVTRDLLGNPEISWFMAH
ncbi:universal stress protein [Sphingobium sp. JS3065]|uniref:universal stress protein n=1 Tax=Sphingobium sp. JS3065 TaxID=2970925 RepID=UPI002263FE0D|nr:universal stress protein [Sphingobium sp. JS3065]UZW55673.1 universal stress protein [Sphingobium sp. JS3065]